MYVTGVNNSCAVVGIYMQRPTYSWSTNLKKLNNIQIGTEFRIATSVFLLIFYLFDIKENITDYNGSEKNPLSGNSCGDSGVISWTHLCKQKF